MAAAIEQELSIDPELIKGDGGVFEVRADGDLVYSKAATGRFPDHEEVLGPLRRRSAG